MRRAPAARLPARAAAAALALALAGCAAPRGTAESPVVTRLDLPGVRSVDQKQLRQRLATQDPDCLLGFVLCDWERLDPDALADDRRRIEAFYRARGFFQAQAGAAVVQPRGEGRAAVSVPVEEGAPVRVSRVDLVGFDVPAEARPAALPIRAGDRFTEAAYDAARDALVAALRTHGYPEATVAQHAQVLPAEGTAELTFTATPGPRLRFGRVFVAGTAGVSREFLAGQAERELTPGDWFDESRLARAQARIFELGAFAGVRVTRGPPDPARGTVPIIVSVREAPFRTLRLGPGLGFQAKRWEAQGVASWTHRNLVGDLGKLQLESRVGYAWLPNPLSPARQEPVGLAAAEFSKPAVIARRVDVSARVEVERSLEEAYGFWAERLRLGTPIRLAPRWTVAPSFNLEVYQLDSVTGGSSATLPQFSNCPKGVCMLTFLEERLVWDGRNDPINTRQGLWAGLSVQQGFPIGGYGYAYLRFLPEARLYLPLGDAVLGVRGRVGILVPVNETGAAPVVALFTSGGAQTMRGYGAGRLSPMVVRDGQWVATGGNGLVDGTIELRVPLRGDWGGVLFLDGGNVSGASGSPTEYQAALDPTRIQLALGLGLRYRTAFGPFRADVALRLPDNWKSGVPFSQRFPTVPGTPDHREPIAALHVTLGEAF